MDYPTSYTDLALTAPSVLTDRQWDGGRCPERIASFQMSHIERVYYYLLLTGFIARLAHLVASFGF